MARVCSTCGLPAGVCICEEIAKEQERIKIYCGYRRYGKPVTIIEGFEGVDVRLTEIAKMLKVKCAAGGTVKNGRIELQGDHKKKVQETLESLGYTVEVK